MLFGQPARFALVLGQGEQKQFAGDKVVAALLGFFIGQIQQIGQFAANLHFAADAFHSGQPFNGLFKRRLQRLHIHARLR